VKLIALLNVLVATFAIFALSAGGAAAKSHKCPNVTVRLSGSDFTYPVRVMKGSVSCRTARSTLKGFIKTGNQPRGWQCFEGHSGQNWAATCVVVNSSGHTRKQIRAYNPIAG
jgi:hypothetical protein